MAYQRKEKDSFIFKYEYLDLFDELNDKQIKNLIYAMVEYDKNGTASGLDEVTKMAFVTIKKKLDKNRINWENKCEQNRENINKRWNTNEYDRIQTNTNYTDRDRDRDRDKDYDYDYNNIEPSKEKNIRVGNSTNSKRSPKPSSLSFSLTSVSNYGEDKSISQECCQNFYKWFSENKKKWKNNEEWQHTLDEWWERDYKNNSEETKLVQLDEGVFIIP